MERSTITPGLAQLKALSHPVRVRMLGLLRAEGPATATMLALRLGLNTGATSYHLRQLAQHGLVTEDAERGNARDRWWQAAHAATTTGPPPTGGTTGQTGDDETEEGRAALDAYLQSVVTVMSEQARRAVEELPTLPEPWRRAASFNDWLVRLTPARAEALVRLLSETVEGVEDEVGDGAATVLVQLSAFRVPGGTP